MGLRLGTKNLWVVSCKAIYGELPVAILVFVL
jgi:hypothetical protein